MTGENSKSDSKTEAKALANAVAELRAAAAELALRIESLAIRTSLLNCDLEKREQTVPTPQEKRNRGEEE